MVVRGGDEGGGERGLRGGDGDGEGVVLEGK